MIVSYFSIFLGTYFSVLFSCNTRSIVTSRPPYCLLFQNGRDKLTNAQLAERRPQARLFVDRHSAFWLFLPFEPKGIPQPFSPFSLNLQHQFHKYLHHISTAYTAQFYEKTIFTAVKYFNMCSQHRTCKETGVQQAWLACCILNDLCKMQVLF